MKKYNIGINQLYGGMIETLRDGEADVVFMIDNRIQTMTRNIANITRYYGIGPKISTRDKFGVFSYYIMRNNTYLVLVQTMNTTDIEGRIKTALRNMEDVLNLNDARIFFSTKDNNILTYLEENIENYVAGDVNLAYAHHNHNTGGKVQWLQQHLEELVMA